MSLTTTVNEKLNLQAWQASNTATFLSYFCTSKTMCWAIHTLTCYIIYVCANCWCEHSAWFHIRQTNMCQKWEMLFSSVRCSWRIDEFSYMSSVSDMSWLWFLALCDICCYIKTWQSYTKNNPHTGNHEFCIVGTAKDQTTWHLCYENNPQNGNHVNESNCQIRNHGNCVIGTTVSLETMAIVLNVHPSERNPWQLNYKNVFQTGNHSNSVTE